MQSAARSRPKPQQTKVCIIGLGEPDTGCKRESWWRWSLQLFKWLNWHRSSRREAG